MTAHVNDVHSALNPTVVRRVVGVTTTVEIQQEVTRCRDERMSLIASGGRHAMGGQQLATDGVLLDTTRVDRVRSFDRERRLIEVEAGIQWPALVAWLEHHQPADDPCRWTIVQKQSGADRFSLGGTISANGHGRGLSLPPIIADVEALTIIDASGSLRSIDRTNDRELFSLVAGGYGLFGVIATITLRLTRAQVLERVVEIRSTTGLAEAFGERADAGFAFGDFQFSTDEHSPDFLRSGVFSCYRPVDPTTPIPDRQRILSPDDWAHLLYLAHTDRAAAYNLYTEHYAATSGQLYRSEALQMADYTDGYHRAIDTALGAQHPSSEMISELYVPRDRLQDFMSDAASLLRSRGVAVIYGTVRVIEPDSDSLLAWATQPWACIIFNLCTEHTPQGIERSANTFRDLIDLAIARGGSYFLTYHRWASLDQLLACYPRFPEFAKAKRHHDPKGLFQSDWYRHYAEQLDG